MTITDEQRLAVLNERVELMTWLGYGPNREWSGRHRTVMPGESKSVLLKVSENSTATSILSSIEKYYRTHLMVDGRFMGTSEPSMTDYSPNDKRFPMGSNRIRTLIDTIILKGPKT